MRRLVLAPALVASLALFAGCGGSGKAAAGSPTSTPTRSATSAAGARADSSRVEVPRAGSIPPLLDPHDVYAAGRPGLLSPVVRHDPARVYVPNSESNTVDVIS